MLDLLHTSMALAANWTYLIEHFGHDPVLDYITWCASIDNYLCRWPLIVLQDYRSDNHVDGVFYMLYSVLTS